jgi:hypothetical protein
MSSIKQLIINAIIKVSGENPALNREGEATAIEARDDFVRLLMLELFPEDAAVVTVATTETAVAKTPKEDATQKAARKVAKADKDAAKAAAAAAKAAEKEAAKVAKAAAKKSPAKSPKKEAKAEVVAPVEESPKKVKKVKKVKEEAPVAEAPASPAKSPKKEKAPKAPKKVKPAEDANLPKMDPTWRKHLKKADKDGGKEREGELLTYLNAYTKEEFNAKKAEDHVSAFLASRATAPAAEAKTADDGKVSADLVTVEFEGKEYCVNVETKRVYEGEGEYDEEVGWTNYKPVGYVGMAAFAEMEV